MNLEWDCLIRARRGEESAWRALVERHQARLAGLALLITGSAAAADDVVQETFIRALRARLKNCAGTVGGFLGTIAYRLALKESRRLKRNLPLDGLDPPDNSHTPLESILIDERDRLVAETIAALDTDHRLPLILRFYGRHSYEEIAKLLGIPLGTVKSRIFYAVKSCRETLLRKGALR